MKSKRSILDTFQIVGFVISTFISIGLMILNQDKVASVTIGLVLAILTQLFDLQIRNSHFEEQVLEANALSRKLYQDEVLLKNIGRD